MNYSVLKSEITNDPAALSYAGKTDQQVADILNAVDKSAKAFVTVNQIRQYLIKQIKGTGVNQRSSLDMIREYAEAGTIRGAVGSETAPAARRSGAQMIWYMLRYGTPDSFFEIDNINIAAQFTAIGPDGTSGPSVLSAAELTAINAMATRLVSRATTLGLEQVAPGHVAEARVFNG